MNTVFFLKRNIFKFKMKNKAVTSIEEYEKTFETENYTPLSISANDKFAVKDYNVDNLFKYSEEYDIIKTSYDFPYNKKLTDIENALNIMDYLTKHTHYCGASLNVLPDNTLDILNYSFDKEFADALNCRFKAIALTDILIAYGIKALPICLRSEENGVHFVVSVYSKEEKRFIMLDPSFNCCFVNDNNTALSVFELRNCLIKNKPVQVINFTFINPEKHKDFYFSAFISDCISNISTWETNIKSKKVNRKICAIDFNTKVPTEL